MPVVYVLTNETMPGIVKVGRTKDLKRRLKSLDTTEVALPFECYYAVEVPDDREIERNVHEVLGDESRVRERREFFYADPERVKSILKIAEKMGGKDVTPTENIFEPEALLALAKAKKNRSRFNFQMVGIEPGTQLEFKKDETITCEVFDDTKVKFRGEITSLSNSALTILKEMGYEWERVSGPLFWCKDGKTLEALRQELEGL